MDTQAIVQGTLNPDGTLSLDAKLSLPPGRVQVIVAPIPDLPADDALGQRMQHCGRSKGPRACPRTAKQQSKPSDVPSVMNGRRGFGKWSRFTKKPGFFGSVLRDRLPRRQLSQTRFTT